jgi:hypothetical protein
MKTGRTLSEMAAELDRQSKAKRDFVAPTTQLEYIPFSSGVPVGTLRVNGHGAYDVTELGHEQIAGRVGIPKQYYDRMRKDAPELLASNVNTWFKRQPEKRMVRTLDNRVRAFLSDRYRPLDNFDLAQIAFDTLTTPGMRIESTELTERRLYVKAVTERIQLEVKKGDMVQAGIVISNSEVGCGSVKVEPMIFRLVCSNGMIAADHSMRKYHVGRSGSEGDFAAEFFKNETRMADDRAFWLKVRDVIQGAFSKDLFEAMVGRMQTIAGNEIKAPADDVVEVVQEKFGLSDDERGGVLNHLIKGGDLTQWGLLNAITRTAQDVPDYDRATELERLGGTVLELPKLDWQKIAEAKAA